MVKICTTFMACFTVGDAIVKMQEHDCKDEVVQTVSQSTDEHEVICICKKYKEELQDKIHKECTCIDCIDYLMYEIEKNK